MKYKTQGQRRQVKSERRKKREASRERRQRKDLSEARMAIRRKADTPGQGMVEPYLSGKFSPRLPGCYLPIFQNVWTINNRME